LKNIQVFDMILWGDVMSLQKRLKKLRKQHGYSQTELANIFGYKSFTTIQKWEDGTSNPPMAVLQKLAQLYHVQLEQLLGDQPLRQSIPVLGIVRGGQPLIATEQLLDLYDVELSDNPQDYFYLRVVGDSMINARIHEGDTVFVHRQPTVNQGDIAVVLIDDEATVKRVYVQENRLILKSENDAYPPMIFTADQVMEQQIVILGKVLHNRINYG